MKKLAYLIILFLATSCIYPFNPEIADQSDHKLVVSGDLIIGEESVITLGYVFPLTAIKAEMRADYPYATVWAEDEDHCEYVAGPTTGSKHYIDLTKAPADKQYRLHVKVTGGSEYVTPWLKVQEAPVISDISYRYTDSDVQLLLSLDGGTTSHFRWDYEEVWEYSADFVPDYMYVPGLPEKDQENPEKIYRERGENEKYYYCWSSSSSVEYGLANTEGQSVNKMIDNNFITISRYNKKLQILYSVLVKARGISVDCYGYLHNMNAISDNTGSLFSPTPSEVRGNISCVSDTTEMVYGYVEATRMSRQRFFIDDKKARLYRRNYDPDSYLYLPVPDEDGKYNFESLYMSGDAPVHLLGAGSPDEQSSGGTPTRTNMQWAPKRCTDCRESGGNKNKPQWWPNDDE